MPPEAQHRNQQQALIAAILVAGTAGWLTWLFPLPWPLLGLCPLAYRWVRRPCLRRMEMMRQPFPEEREQILRKHVDFFLAIDEAGKIRFRQLVQTFLDEVRITGIRTEATRPLECWWRPAPLSRSSGSMTGNIIGCMKC